jgi:biofilm PGA synthesis N-glycosyltransferase PgaC
MGPQDGRVLVITPVHNEAEHLERTAASLAAQSRPPDRWVIVDDGSRDATPAIARKCERELPYVTVLRAPQSFELAERDRLAVANEARAFNFGLRASGWHDYTHVGKLDGDVELPPEWFASLLGHFEAEPRLGIAGGRLAERTPTEWQLIPIPATHVHGAVKLWSRECLQSVGGIRESLGWDTIDETYARMLGFRTHSFADLVARHHRHWASADGRLRGRARHGECAWILHQTLPWALLRSLKLALVPPRGLSGAAFLYGYATAALRRTPRVEDRDFRRFVRRELRKRMLAPLDAVFEYALGPRV